MDSRPDGGRSDVEHRRERHAAVADELRSLSDHDLIERLARAGPVGSGIGGTHAIIDVGDVAVFVKQIPLTSVEREPAHHLSTRNLFDMPTECQYGVGSPGFGVWREVRANEIATDLVLNGRLGAFAATYHWRTLDVPPSNSSLWTEFEDIDAFAAHWHGSPGVRRRVEAIAGAPAQVALFLEYIPLTLPRWLVEQTGTGEPAASAAIDLAERCLLEAVPAMNSSGLFHFDAHFANVLTDGQHLYFADLGLATSPAFDLSRAERDFLDHNVSHDMCHTITRLVDWLVARFVGLVDHEARDTYIASITPDTMAPTNMNRSAWRVIKRYAPVATVMNAFYRQLHGGDRTTPYPVALMLEACERARLEPPTMPSPHRPLG